MAFQNYYVGSNLSDIGRQMGQDRATEAQLQAQYLEQNRLANAQLMQALQQRAAMEQQGRQFNQELAMRGQAQQQSNAYQNAVLDLQRQQQQFGQGSITPFQQAEMENRLKIAQAGAQNFGPAGIAALLNQQGLNQRSQAEQQEALDYEEAASRSKAARWNNRVKLLEDSIEQEKAEHGGVFSRKSVSDAWAKAELPKRYSALIAELEAVDKSPGTVAPDDTGRRFIPILPRGRGGVKIPGTVNPLAPPPPVGTGTVLREDAPITVRTSDGKILQGKASQFQALKAVDPGAEIFTPGGTARTNPRQSAVVQALQQSQQPNQALLPSMARNAYDYIGNTMAPVAESMQRTYGNLRDYLIDNPYQQLINSNWQRQYDPALAPQYDYNPVP